MAQTTGAISPRSYTILYSPDGVTYTNVAGFTVKITPAQGTRVTGEVNTFDGDLPIVTVGKRKAQLFHVEYVYTEGASDFFETGRISYEAATDFYLRYSPKGNLTGQFQFTTLAGKIQNFAYPQGDAGSGAPVVLGFDLFVPALVKSVAP